MILTAHQPVYLPWLGLFHKIVLAETYCVFDIAQYQKKDFINRNKIKTFPGPIWLSVPVEAKEHFEKRICDIRIIHDGWAKKHLRSMQMSYMKAPFFKDYFSDIERIINTQHAFLTDLNTDLLRYFLDCLNIKIPIVRASDYNFQGTKSDLVLDMCVKLKADKYIFGTLGRDYANVPSFEEKNIQVFFQDYHHPSYQQLYGEFLPYMSIVDLLFNEGPKSREILMSGNIQTV